MDDEALSELFHKNIYNIFIYRPSSKLQEGNVVRRLCVSVHKGSYVTIIPLPACPSPAPPRNGTSLYRDPSSNYGSVGSPPSQEPPPQYPPALAPC